MRTDSIDYKSRVTVDGQCHFGKPCVAGTRILVEQALELIQEGVSFAKITKTNGPDLTAEDVKACASYERDAVRREEIHLETMECDFSSIPPSAFSRGVDFAAKVTMALPSKICRCTRQTILTCIPRRSTCIGYESVATKTLARWYS